MYLADARLLPLHSKWVGLRVMVDVGTTNGRSFSACSSQWVMPTISVTPKFPSWIDTEGFMSWKKITKDKFHSIDNEAGEVKRPTNSKAIPESFIWVRSWKWRSHNGQGKIITGSEQKCPWDLTSEEGKKNVGQANILHNSKSLSSSVLLILFSCHTERASAMDPLEEVQWHTHDLCVCGDVPRGPVLCKLLHPHLAPSGYSPPMWEGQTKKTKPTPWLQDRFRWGREKENIYECSSILGPSTHLWKCSLYHVIYQLIICWHWLYLCLHCFPYAIMSHPSILLWNACSTVCTGMVNSKLQKDKMK